jgi:hypothetical protein
MPGTHRAQASVLALDSVAERRRLSGRTRPEDSGYFNLLQAHCKNLKCVDLTGAPARFVFEIALPQSNILVRRRSAVRSCPWAPLQSEFKRSCNVLVAICQNANCVALTSTSNLLNFWGLARRGAAAEVMCWPATGVPTSERVDRR